MDMDMDLDLDLEMEMDDIYLLAISIMPPKKAREVPVPNFHKKPILYSDLVASDLLECSLHHLRLLTSMNKVDAQMHEDGRYYYTMRSLNKAKKLYGGRWWTRLFHIVFKY